jgi:hypothetical protein
MKLFISFSPVEGRFSCFGSFCFLEERFTVLHSNAGVLYSYDIKVLVSFRFCGKMFSLF